MKRKNENEKPYKFIYFIRFLKQNILIYSTTEIEGQL